MSWNATFLLLARLLVFVCPDSPSITGPAHGAPHPHDRFHLPACGYSVAGAFYVQLSVNWRLACSP